MALLINRLTNANVYLDGVSYLGRVEELDLPKVKSKMIDHKALGMVGETEFPSGFEKMESRLKWSAFYPEAFGVALNPTKVYNLMARCNLETYTPQGRLTQLPVVYSTAGIFKDMDLGQFRQNETVTMECMMTVYYAKLIVAGATLFEVDVLANIYKVNGENLLEGYKLNTGA